MRILLDKTQLCGSGEPHTGLSFNGLPSVQVDEFLRAAQKDFTDRGNLSVQISFGVTRKFASVDEAEVFILDHQAEANGVGILTFEGQKYKRYAKGKCSVTCEPPSRSVEFRYSIECTPPAKTRPAS